MMVMSYLYCIESYYTDYPGFYCTADAGYIDVDGHVFVMARTDDVINVAGHRLMLNSLDHEASRLGVTHQSIIKVWLAERLAQLTANKRLKHVAQKRAS